ncbi:hypothetical protein [Halioxenophilus aromaticivorans]|uniref:Outer membrane protein beta-barrel domain-containing protein n=1 Tax=Halioxenophilus aromaticivorans TaxID=1306992 RepID=A0AAV3U250_9ALTE
MVSTKIQCKKLLSIVAAVFFGFSHFVSAESWQEGWYIGWGHTNVRTKLISPDYPYSRKGDYTSNDPIFNFGYNFTENFGLEADAVLADEYRVFGRFSFPIANRAEVYLRAGGRYEAVHGGRSDVTPMVGAGVRYYFNKNFGINFGWDYGKQSYREDYIYRDPITNGPVSVSGDEEVKFQNFNATFMWHF